MTVGDRTRFDPCAYGRWRTTRLGAVTEALERKVLLDLAGPMKGHRVLDVGCGDGAFAHALAAAGAEVYGIDISPKMLNAARRSLQGDGGEARLVGGDTRWLPFGDASFDLVTAVTTLCFVEPVDRAVAEIERVLKPSGRLVIGELGRHSSWAAWRRLRGWFGNPAWRSARFRSMTELRNLATRAGLIVETTRAAVFYPPVGWAATVFAPLDSWLGHRLTVGGAFLALAASKPKRQ